MAQHTTPKLRFPEFSGAWEEKKLKDVTKYTKGFAFQSASYSDNGIRIIRVSDLTSNSIKEDNEKVFIEVETAQNYSKYKILEENIIVTTVGSKPELVESAVGRAIYVDKPEIGLLNQNLLKFEKIENTVNRFILGCISSKKYQQHIKDISRGNANQANITVEDLLSFNLSIPSLPEQQKIASFLSAADKKLEQLQQKKTLLEQYKKGMMQKLFSQQIRFKDDEGKDFPEWEEKFANRVFENYSNKNHNGDLPILSASQLYGMVLRDDNGIKIQATESSVKSYKIVEKGSFVISLRSFQGGIEYSEIRGICSPAYIILKPLVTIEDSFFKHYFKWESFIERLSKTVVGIRDGKQITYDNFSSLKLPLPTVAEQTKIAEFLTAIDAKIAAVSAQVTAAKGFKKGLLQQMFV